MGKIRVFDPREQLLLPNYYDRLNDQGHYHFSNEEIDEGHTLIDDTVFWAEQMKPAREKLLG